MPVRDGARWLGEAIASIQNQTLTEFELIVIDDGSTDESPHIIDTLSRSDPRIIALRQERLGLVAALNRGLAASRGQFIVRLDADDIANAQRLQRQSEYLETHPRIGLLGTWADKINEQGLVVGTLRPATEPQDLMALLDRANPFVHSSVMMRKTVLEKVGCYRAAFAGAEDYDLWLRMSEATGIANMAEYLVQYRVHSAGVSHTAQVRQLFSARLAQQAARARRTTGDDPTSKLLAPPDWHAPDHSDAIGADLAKLFRFLELAGAKGTNARAIDLSPLRERDLVLNHAERRIAQLVVLKLLTNKVPTELPRPVLLWHLIRLHPLRAIRLGYQAFRGRI